MFCLVRSKRHQHKLIIWENLHPEGEETTLVAFQLLHLKEIIMHAETYLDGLDGAGKYDVSVQEYERHRPGFNELADPPSSLDIFSLKDSSSRFDLVKMIATKDNLANFMEWTNIPSPVDGCERLHLPTPIRPECPLQSPQCPTLCLLQAFLDQGFM